MPPPLPAPLLKKAITTNPILLLPPRHPIPSPSPSPSQPLPLPLPLPRPIPKPSSSSLLLLFFPSLRNQIRRYPGRGIRGKGSSSSSRWMSPGSELRERSLGGTRRRRRLAGVGVAEGKRGEAKAMGRGSDSLLNPSQNHGRGEDQINGNSCCRDQESPPRLLTIPTVLTIGRVAAVPLLASTFYMEGRWATTATTSIFLAAAVTDWLDGYIARKMRLGTAFGAFLDPVADKLMVAATLVLLCNKPLEAAIFGEFQWLLTIPSIAIIGREITMSAVREWAASQNSKVLEAVAVNNLGKWKTATQMTSLTILLAARDSSLSGAGVLVGSGVVLLYISAWLAVWSLVVYMRKIWRILLKL
ncbi:CDP-diacylglycerol--glycerol-3-phosphate 3-phosphatidyltransferase 1, chloroplastic [Ananas comosus]|uniref:CDP-diacylglycerol--glycerol-3-phosphate 3-phosphatidyltransferase 1, chloroplastic n=1 Tax=Ananas comosus TaxID=4615 RepID=A0A199UDB7_ANACO|nr:CDP-diacylglycerol--glycerol-3-phosphate 3-phosphatidyltransferase 1, chloroplastic [Ananas comosus]